MALFCTKVGIYLVKTILDCSKDYLKKTFVALEYIFSSCVKGSQKTKR